MKKIFMLFLFIFNSSFANQGVVIVLEAPMLKEREMNSQVLQITRKGETIFIHGKDLSPDSYQRTLSERGVHEFDDDLEDLEFESNVIPKELEESFEKHGSEDFYQTMTKNGQIAFIPKKFVKAITHDFREFEEEISPFNHDPTDYRIEEPLPKAYPLRRERHKKGNFSVLFGTQRKANYPYPATILNERFRTAKGFDLSFARPAQFDSHRKFFYGFSAHLLTSESEFNLSNKINATESKAEFGAGGFVNYEFYRAKYISLHFAGGVLFSYKRTVIKQDDGSNETESRNFSGWNIYPNFRTYLRFPKVINDEIDLFAGIEMKLHILPFSLKGSQSEETDLWNKEDHQISYSTGAQTALHFGAQVSY